MRNDGKEGLCLANAESWHQSEIYGPEDVEEKTDGRRCIRRMLGNGGRESCYEHSWPLQQPLFHQQWPRQHKRVSKGPVRLYLVVEQQDSTPRFSKKGTAEAAT